MRYTGFKNYYLINRPKGLFLQHAKSVQLQVLCRLKPAATVSSYHVLLIALFLFVPLLAGATDTCKKSDKGCRVPNEAMISETSGIFSDFSGDVPVVLPRGIADSTGSVVSGTGLSISTAIGGTDVPAADRLKLEKSKPAELTSPVSPTGTSGGGISSNIHKKNLSGMGRMFILLAAVLFVLIILVYFKNSKKHP